MDNSLMRIGDMARLNKVSVPTLRLYDEMGLLTPSYTDPETGYRYYSIRQNARLDMIQYMKELCMSLAEIKEILDAGDIRLIESTLIMKKKQVKEQIADLKLRLDAIGRTIECVERFRKAPVTGMTTVEYIPHRRIYSMQTNVNFYDYDISVYESILSKLKDNMLSNGLPQVYYCNAGTVLRRKDFLAEKFFSDEIFVFVDDSFPDGANIRRVESGMYACIYADSFDDEKKYAKTLLDYCRDNSFKICGDYICEVLTEFNVFDSDARSMFLRLQVPLRFR